MVTGLSKRGNAARSARKRPPSSREEPAPATEQEPRRRFVGQEPREWHGSYNEARRAVRPFCKRTPVQRDYDDDGWAWGEEESEDERKDKDKDKDAESGELDSESEESDSESEEPDTESEEEDPEGEGDSEDGGPGAGRIVYALTAVAIDPAAAFGFDERFRIVIGHPSAQSHLDDDRRQWVVAQFHGPSMRLSILPRSTSRRVLVEDEILRSPAGLPIVRIGYDDVELSPLYRGCSRADVRRMVAAETLRQAGRENG